MHKRVFVVERRLSVCLSVCHDSAPCQNDLAWQIIRFRIQFAIWLYIADGRRSRVFFLTCATNYELHIEALLFFRQTVSIARGLSVIFGLSGF